MASFQVIGVIECVKYIPNGGGCFVFVSEYKKGYKTKEGVSVEDRYLQWKCIFKQGLVKYVSDHFFNGMLVEIKGEILPYAKNHDEMVDGYSVLAQCINVYSFPRYGMKQEHKMIHDSQISTDEKPDLEAYKEPDF